MRMAYCSVVEVYVIISSRRCSFDEWKKRTEPKKIGCRYRMTIGCLLLSIEEKLVKIR